jgi:hypothetical protein
VAYFATANQAKEKSTMPWLKDIVYNLDEVLAEIQRQTTEKFGDQSAEPEQYGVNDDWYDYYRPRHLPTAYGIRKQWGFDWPAILQLAGYVPAKRGRYAAIAAARRSAKRRENGADHAPSKYPIYDDSNPPVSVLWATGTCRRVRAWDGGRWVICQAWALR